MLFIKNLQNIIWNNLSKKKSILDQSLVQLLRPSLEKFQSPNLAQIFGLISICAKFGPNFISNLRRFHATF